MTAKEKRFIATVEDYYQREGRHDLPWRTTNDPYRILVSEVMLQQTQVSRVREKYREFLRRFPSTRALARSPLGEVLRVWQGLGYNRRAKLLWECARLVHHDYRGRWPRTYAGLVALPGVGPYTAAAVMAFAYDEGVPLIETNVRTVYLYHFFPRATAVPDAAILALVRRHLPHVSSPRAWYAAVMDYGSYLKRTQGNPNHRAKAHVKQGRFTGSDRQLRGCLLRALAGATHVPLRALANECAPFREEQITQQLQRLTAEGLVARTRGRYHLPS